MPRKSLRKKLLQQLEKRIEQYTAKIVLARNRTNHDDESLSLSSFSSISSLESLSSSLSSTSTTAGNRKKRRRRKETQRLKKKQKSMARLHKSISGRRYLQRGPYRNYSNFVFEEDLKSSIDDNRSFLNDNEFLHKYRMKRSTFQLLLSKIRHHEVFQRRGGRLSGRKQQDVTHQLLVFLHYLGTEGSGQSDKGQRSVFRKGQGSGRQWSRRVCRAIIECLEDDYLRWPDAEERQDISERIRKQHYFPNCVGLIDGTLTPLAFRPETEDAPDYKGRKVLYSLSMLVVCDDKRRVLYFIAGWPGSAHDNRIFRNSRLYRNPEEFFTDIEYLLGDSAFECQRFMIPSYKKAAGLELERNKEKFNQALSKPRVESEHCIGMLKGRFPWMRSIRVKITERRSSKLRILNLIKASMILHNFLIDEADPCLEEWEAPDDSSSEDASSLSSGDELNQSVADAKSRRHQLTNFVVDMFP